MRAPRYLYDALRKLKDDEGRTMHLSLQTVDELLSRGLVVPDPLGNTYRLKITARGYAVIDSTPLEP